MSKPKIQRIAVIGGGPSGIATAKCLLAEESFATIQVFEQSDNVQGAWKHTSLDTGGGIDVPQMNPYQPLGKPKTSPVDDNNGLTFVTPMYDDLETNIPRQIMAFADKPFPKDSVLYPPRDEVSRYLEDYAEDVKHLIRYHTQVQDVRLVSTEPRDVWQVSTRDLVTGHDFREQFDAVIICSGHYDSYYIPDVPGITEWNQAYPGSISHSKFYRERSNFAGKKTIVVGNSASGVDIAAQVAEVALKPVFVSQRSTSWLGEPNSTSADSHLVMSPQIAEYLDPTKYDRAIRFADGHIEFGIEEILYCTGYLYSYPFLSDFQQEIIQDGIRVHGIYKFIFFTKHPSLAFVGLPMRIIPFPLSQVQAAVIAKVYSEQLSLPSRTDMDCWESETVAENGQGKKFLTLDQGKDFIYHNKLYDWAQEAGFRSECVPNRWSAKETWLRSKFPEIKKAYTQRGEAKYKIKTPEQLGFVYNEIKGDR